MLVVSSRVPHHLAASRHRLAAAPPPLLSISLPYSWRDDVPNALTMGRVAAVPILIGAFYCVPLYTNSNPHVRLLPAFIFALCAFTDWLDGFLARRWSVNSEFGAFLDPVADKLLVCTCLCLLSGAQGAIVALPTAVIVSREVAVSALREWMGARGERDSVAVGFAGKVKTAAQMVALQLLLLAPPPPRELLAMASLIGAAAPPSSLLRNAGLVLLYAATVLGCTSAAGYFKAAWPLLSRVDEA